VSRRSAVWACALSAAALLALLASPDPARGEKASGDDAFARGRRSEDRLELYAAREAFREAVQVAPDNRGYAEHRAWFLLTHGYPEEAAASFEEMIASFGPTADLFKGLGWSLKLIGRLEQSLAAYRRVYPLQKDTDFPGAFAALGVLIHEENAKRIAAVRARIAAEGPAVALRQSLMDLLLDQGELAEALEIAEGILSERPDDSLLRLRYARALRWKGQPGTSAAEYERLLVAFPDNVPLQIERLTILKELGRNAADEALRLQAREAGLRDALALSRLSGVLAAGRPAEALASANRIVPSGPDRLLGLLAQAQASLLSGDRAAASAIYRAVIRDYPYNQEALWGLLQITVASGQRSEAGVVLSRWRDAVPDDRFRAQEALLALYAAPAVTGHFSWLANSSGFSRWDAGLSGAMFPALRLSVTAAGFESFFSRSGLDTLQRTTAEVDVKAGAAEGRILLSGSVKGERWQDNNDDLNGRLGIVWHVKRNTTLSVGWGRISIVDSEPPFGNGLYNHVVSYGAAALGVQSSESEVHLLWDPSPRVNLAVLASSGSYSDGNLKSSLVLEAGWLVATQPRLRLVYDYSYLDFRDPAPIYTNGTFSESAYWDPRAAVNHTLRLELAHHLSKRLVVECQGALSYAPSVSGWSELLMASLQWGISSRGTFRLDARGFNQDHGIERSGERGGSYQAANITAALEFRFSSGGNQ